MQTVPIDRILECMNSEKNYFGDMWETCLDDNKKRFSRAKLKDVLKKMETLGHIKKYGYKNNAYYTRHYHFSLEENIGFVNNLIFTYESKINTALKKLENRKVFSEISRDLNSCKVGYVTKRDYELLLEGITGMFELASSILWTRDNGEDSELRKAMNGCFKQISEFMKDANKALLEGRKTNERVVLQRVFSNKIPEAGRLKI